jgi:outer membrane protein TolC
MLRRKSFDAEALLARTRQALSLILDLPGSDADRLEVEGLLTRPPVLLPSLKDSIQLACEARPDLVALRLGLDRARSDLIAARQRALNESRRDRQAQSGPKDDPARANLARAELNVRQAQNQLASQERQVVSEVERCYRDWCQRLVELPRLEEDARAARQSRDATERSYETGEVGGDIVVDARHKCEEREQRYADLLVQHRRSTLALNTAIGQRVMP